MRWIKVAAIVVGVMIAFLVVSSVIGFLIEAVIAVLAVAVIALAAKVAISRRQVSSRQPRPEVRGRRSGKPLRRASAADVEDDLARLKRTMGG